MTDAAGIPIGVAIDGANRNDCKLIEQTLDSVPVERPAVSDGEPQGVCLDKGYDFDFVRELLTGRHFTPHVRSRGEEAKDLREDPTRRARRWVVERIHSWVNRYRGMLIRWSKNAENHQALLKFCFASIVWQQAGAMPLLR